MSHNCLGRFWFLLTLSLNNNSYIFMPPLAAHYIWSYFHGMSSDFYWNMGEIAHIPSKELSPLTLAYIGPKNPSENPFM
jgi:hypothetical protein